MNRKTFFKSILAGIGVGLAAKEAKAELPKRQTGNLIPGSDRQDIGPLKDRYVHMWGYCGEWNGDSGTLHEWRFVDHSATIDPSAKFDIKG